MSDQKVSAKAILKFFGGETDQNEISAEVLVRSLSAVQQIAFLLGAFQAHHPLKDRFTLSQKLRQKFRLKCGIPQEGSYQLALGFPMPNGELPFQDASTDLLNGIQEILLGLFHGKPEIINKVIPDSRYRERVLREIQEFLPQSGENWNLGFSANGQPFVNLSSQHARTARKWLEAPSEPEEEIITITGELVAIEFEKHLVTVRYPPTKKEIQCSYLPEIEETLFEKRRDLVQVTGKFTLDSEGHPIKLTEVSRISDVDLNTMTFTFIPYLNGQLRFLFPFLLNPEIDETKQLLVIDYPDFDLHVFSTTREGLEEEIVTTMGFLWDSYVKEDPNNFSVEAQNLRDRLMKNIREVPNAP